MLSSRVVLCVLLLSMISMHGIHARGLGVEFQPEKLVGKALKKEDNILAIIEKLVSSVALTWLNSQEHGDGPSTAGS